MTRSDDPMVAVRSHRPVLAGRKRVLLHPGVHIRADAGLRRRVGVRDPQRPRARQCNDRRAGNRPSGAVLMIACRRYGRKPAARSSASVTSEVAAERCHDKQ